MSKINMEKYTTEQVLCALIMNWLKDPVKAYYFFFGRFRFPPFGRFLLVFGN